MFGISLISDKLYQGAILVMGVSLVGLFIHVKTLEAEKFEAISEKDKVVADHNVKLAAMEKKLRKSDELVSSASETLSTTISDLEVKRNEQVNKIRTSSDTVIASLKLRASRPTGSPTKPGQANQYSNNESDATGASLFRQDAEFLVGEATRADFQREALKTCYSDWDSLVKTVKDLNSKILTEEK